MGALLIAAAAGGCKRDCSEAEADARELLAGAASVCQTDSDCRVLDFAVVTPNSCVGAFQCSTAVRANLELTAFTARAQEISADKRDCGECIMAGCLAPESFRAICNQQSRRCELATVDGQPGL